MNAVFFIILIFNLWHICYSGTLPPSQQNEQTLITSLFNGYNKSIRPDTTVSVDITSSLQQIISLDEKQQIMTSSSFISQTWYDERLSWSPTSYNDTDVVMLPVKSLWIPDTMILNSADANGYLPISDYSLASVLFTGQVYMILPAFTIKTRCNLYVQMFPFDKQMCSINLTSWAQGDNRIAYTENNSLVIDISQYSQHALWRLVKTDMIVVRGEDRVPFEWAYNNIISIQLYLQRKPLFYVLNGIFACLVLNGVTLLAFSLPFLVQINLCMVCFLTYSFYSLNFSSAFPQQSDYAMMITIYFLLSICWTLISMAWFIVRNQLVTSGEMSETLYVFCGRLQRLFFCCFPKPKPTHPIDEKRTETIRSQKRKFTFNQIIFAPRRQNRITPERVSQEKHISAEEMQSIQALEITKCIIMKEKCHFCERCVSCEAELAKDKIKTKHKKDIGAKIDALNYLVFLCVLLCVFVSNLILWLLMAQ